MATDDRQLNNSLTFEQLTLGGLTDRLKIVASLVTFQYFSNWIVDYINNTVIHTFPVAKITQVSSCYLTC